MDRRKNPYTPNAGAPPPALAGREEQLETFDILLDRLLDGYTEQSMLISGLRGVGKTVLLGEFRRVAEEKHWTTVETEFAKDISFGPRMVRLAREALLDLAPPARWKERGRRAAAVLSSFSLKVEPDGSLTTGLDVEPATGVADSGDLDRDLTDLFVALGEAAREQGSGVVFLLDEMQDLQQQELAAIVAAVHKTVQRVLPLTVVGAGLPQLPRLAVEAKSYAERLFRFPEIGRLDPSAAETALVQPATALRVDYTADAVEFIVDYTEGYPYFVQLYGQLIWNTAQVSPITLQDARDVRHLVERALDESFFRVRTDRTTETELAYLRAMAELGAKPQRAGDVAKRMNRTVEQMGTTRARLISKGLLYTPGHGFAGFTVPQFDRYLKRSFPLHVPTPRTRPGK